MAKKCQKKLNISKKNKEHILKQYFWRLSSLRAATGSCFMAKRKILSPLSVLFSLVLQSCISYYHAHIMFEKEYSRLSTRPSFLPLKFSSLFPSFSFSQFCRLKFWLCAQTLCPCSFCLYKHQHRTDYRISLTTKNLAVARTFHTLRSKARRLCPGPGLPMNFPV